MSKKSAKKREKSIKAKGNPLFAKVGLIGGCTQETADGFIEAIRKDENKKAKFAFKEVDDICVNCLHSFVANNKLSVLFLEENLTINDEPNKVYDQVVSYIGYMHDCKIYIVAKVE